MASVAVGQVSAVSGGPAALLCDIQPEGLLEQVATVLWYRRAEGQPFFT